LHWSSKTLIHVSTNKIRSFQVSTSRKKSRNHGIRQLGRLRIYMKAFLQPAHIVVWETGGLTKYSRPNGRRPKKGKRIVLNENLDFLSIQYSNLNIQNKREGLPRYFRKLNFVKIIVTNLMFSSGHQDT
jgi:hypothetical protein